MRLEIIRHVELFPFFSEIDRQEVLLRSSSRLSWIAEEASHVGEFFEAGFDNHATSIDATLLFACSLVVQGGSGPHFGLTLCIASEQSRWGLVAEDLVDASGEDHIQVQNTDLGKVNLLPTAQLSENRREPCFDLLGVEPGWVHF